VTAGSMGWWMTRFREESARLRSDALRVAAACLALALLCTWPVEGHEAIEQQIQDLNKRIAETPEDAVLFLRRGELHRVHEDWDAAAADYQTARRLDPGLLAVDLCQGRMLLEQGRPGPAKEALDRFLSRRPEDVEGLRLRGRILARLGRPADAAADYRRALELAPPGTMDPDAYLELAEVLSASSDSKGREAALEALDRGMKDLGPVVSLAFPAVDLEVDLGRFDDALKRLDAATPRSGRKESWLLKRAEILGRAGRKPEAEAAYREVLKQVEALPEARRASPAVQEIEKEARSRLAKVSKNPREESR
jgi:tetratricopeptide (TPR) repeat protein